MNTGESASTGRRQAAGGRASTMVTVATLLVSVVLHAALILTNAHEEQGKSIQPLHSIYLETRKTLR